jgi:lipopolysaccharide assembly LapA-like protein
MTPPDRKDDGPRRGATRIGARDIAAGVLAAGGIAFAVLNSTDVTVNWIVVETTTPLVIVILVSGLCGAGVARLVSWRRGRRSGDDAG